MMHRKNAPRRPVLTTVRKRTATMHFLSRMCWEADSQQSARCRWQKHTPITRMEELIMRRNTTDTERQTKEKQSNLKASHIRQWRTTRHTCSLICSKEHLRRMEVRTISRWTD